MLGYKPVCHFPASLIWTGGRLPDFKDYEAGLGQCHVRVGMLNAVMWVERGLNDWHLIILPGDNYYCGILPANGRLGPVMAT